MNHSQLFQSINPADGTIVWEGCEASSTAVDQAVQYAAAASASWSCLSINERSAYFIGFEDKLKEKKQFLAEVISKETGKPLWESRNEVNAMIAKIPLSLEAYGARCAGIIHRQEETYSITRHRPHGVVAVMGPFNFPGHLPNGHIVPALLAGNTIVFKPSELTPWMGEEMVRCWHEAGLPPGVLNLIQGGRSTGQALASHPAIQGLFFTGSYSTGKSLTALFANMPGKILALEMGGNNPLVIGRISDWDAAVDLTIESAFLTSGQRCTCARRLIVPRSKEGDFFIDKLTDQTKKITIGTYTDDPEPYMGPVITEKQALNLIEEQRKLVEKGGRAILEMRQLKKGTGLVTPSLIDVTAMKERIDEEFFGPLLQIIRVNDFAEAIAEANNTKYGLSAALFSDSHDEYSLFYQSVKAGVINWNTPLTGATSAAPFGGVKCSGNHRPSAFYAADYCAYPVASMERPTLSKDSKTKRT
jgi:succinylglutamic semialdehyde dehydrogenase